MKAKVIVTIIAVLLMAVFNDEAVSAMMSCVIFSAWGFKIVEEGLKRG